MMRSPKIIFIVGPTAVGKSAVAVFLAKQIKGEIISCDAMQVYQEVHIASNKPSPQELKDIPHHLIDIVSVEQKFDVAQFNQLALVRIQEIHRKGHIPIVAGGSGFYAQVLLDGIFEDGERDEELREALKQKALEEGPGVLYEQLKMKDPKAAAKIHPNDVKKLIRAMEVCLSENKPISQLQPNRKGIWGQYDISLFVLNQPREKLYQRIDERVEEMFCQGLVDEIKSLLNKKLSYTAEGIIGVSEIRGYLNGEYPLEEAKNLMKRNTRHYAKRQVTWFKKDQRFEWIELSEGVSYDKVVEHIRKKIGLS
ncbi:MAG: tRNA (adenosine(37)-N6)-dimethylallyltransferase MiaA [Candidatus Omnitrophica bacterium]|nr:tRNA (adenosine(37)-N6)-dimethylallyltransferase MiaA [Candidatus Omnitrophota bacterium]